MLGIRQKMSLHQLLNQNVPIVKIEVSADFSRVCAVF